jgi:hypothetical protein
MAESWQRKARFPRGSSVRVTPRVRYMSPSSIVWPLVGEKRRVCGHEPEFCVGRVSPSGRTSSSPGLTQTGYAELNLQGYQKITASGDAVAASPVAELLSADGLQGELVRDGSEVDKHF